MKPPTRGVAIFACEQRLLFEACQPASVSIAATRSSATGHISIRSLASATSTRCAAVLIDTHTARIFVFSAGETEQYLEIQNPKGKHIKSGGPSQARLQRHAGNSQLLHVKDVIERLETVVRANAIEYVVLAGDEVVVPLFKSHLPQMLAERLVDVVRLDIRSAEPEVLSATLELMRRHDAARDLALVQQVVGDSRAGGRAVVGVADTRRALRDGRVETLRIAALPEQVPGSEAAADAGSSSPHGRRRQRTFRGRPRADEAGRRAWPRVALHGLKNRVGGSGLEVRGSGLLDTNGRVFLFPSPFSLQDVPYERT